MGQDVIDMLSDYRKWHISKANELGDQWIDSGKIFTSWNGKPINPGTVSAWFHKFIIKNDLPYISIHGLRHKCFDNDLEWCSDNSYRQEIRT